VRRQLRLDPRAWRFWLVSQPQRRFDCDYDLESELDRSPVGRKSALPARLEGLVRPAPTAQLGARYGPGGGLVNELRLVCALMNSSSRPDTAIRAPARPYLWPIQADEDIAPLHVGAIELARRVGVGADIPCAQSLPRHVACVRAIRGLVVTSSRQPRETAP
jgi:hypothetical protein